MTMTPAESAESTPDPIEVARSWWGDKEADRMAAARERPSVVNDDAEPAEPDYCQHRRTPCACDIAADRYYGDM